MRTLDDITYDEVTNPDLTAGYVSEPTMYAPRDAYTTIDNITKFALDEDDYEEVLLYHRWTPEEIAERGENERRVEQEEIMASPA